MALQINQKLCMACGNCQYICPQEAIIEENEIFSITDSCIGCRSCLDSCSFGAIKESTLKTTPVQTESNHAQIAEELYSKLNLKRNIVAMKLVDKTPDDIPSVAGSDFWCNICGDIFEEKKRPVFFKNENSTCGSTLMMGIGVKKNTARESYKAGFEGNVIGEGKLYATKKAFREGCKSIPKFNKIYNGMLIGALDYTFHPDIVVFPINGHQMNMIATAYSFDTGEIIRGMAGFGTCALTIPIPFNHKKPVFTCGDHGGRTFMRLREDEMLISFPYQLLPDLVKNLDRTIYGKH